MFRVGDVFAIKPKKRFSKPVKVKVLQVVRLPHTKEPIQLELEVLGGYIDTPDNTTGYFDVEDILNTYVPIGPKSLETH